MLKKIMMLVIFTLGVPGLLPIELNYPGRWKLNRYVYAEST